MVFLCCWDWSSNGTVAPSMWHVKFCLNLKVLIVLRLWLDGANLGVPLRWLLCGRQWFAKGLLKSPKHHPFAVGAYSCLLFFERVAACYCVSAENFAENFAWIWNSCLLCVVCPWNWAYSCLSFPVVYCLLQFFVVCLLLLSLEIHAKLALLSLVVILTLIYPFFLLSRWPII